MGGWGHKPIITKANGYFSNTGGETLFIGMVLLANDTGLGVEVRIQDTWAPVGVQMARGLEVVLPPLPAGLYRISVSINGINIHSQGWGDPSL